MNATERRKAARAAKREGRIAKPDAPREEKSERDQLPVDDSRWSRAKGWAGKHLGLAFIATAFAGFLLNGALTWVKDALFNPSPRVVVDFTTYQALREPNDESKHRVLFFATMNGEGLMALVDTEQDPYTLGGNGKVDANYILHCDRCAQYAVHVRNIGRARSGPIAVTLRSKGPLTLIKSSLDKSIKHDKCGGMLDDYGCQVEIVNLDPGASAYFMASESGSTSSDPKDVACSGAGDRDVRCDTDYHRIWFLDPENPKAYAGYNNTPLPCLPLNAGPDQKMYYFDADKNLWRDVTAELAGSPAPFSPAVPPAPPAPAR